MARRGVDPGDSYLYPSHNNPFIGGRLPKGKAAGWRKPGFVPTFASHHHHHHHHPVAVFTDQQRASLKSLLAQINPKLTPRIRRANTKDAAVQVNPRRDASVQCSIGPRTLQSSKRQARRQDGSRLTRGGSTSSSTSSTSSPFMTPEVRFMRTLAVYSPVTYRSYITLPEGEQGEEEEREERERVEREREEDEEENIGEKVQQDRSVETSSPKLQDEEEETQLQSADESKDKPRLQFQFLEQKYGYYHCKKCSLRWESAYVWCVQGTNKVYFKQYCRKCQKAFNPYCVEAIACPTCNRARCCCETTQRHVDPKRPHRQDLCGRCRGKRLSCDSTFSFKYIV